MLRLIYLLLLLPTLAFPQEKRDYVWVLGYDTDLSVPGGEGTKINFNNNSVSVEFLEKDMNFHANCGIGCNAEGSLLFYTNGCFIANKIHVTMENGDGINPGQIHNNYCEHGYPGEQASLVLPDPGDANSYYLLHVPFAQGGYHSDHLYKTVIDMGLDGGYGEVVEKNVAMISDSLWTGHLTAARHANNTDWWILAARLNSNQYYKLKLSADGLEVAGLQGIGVPLTGGFDGQAVFSPDGTKYAWVDKFQQVLLFDFDRATGELGNFRQLHVADTMYFTGAAISPNSRFLYVSNAIYLYQYDLWAADIQASQVTVDTFDGFNSPFPANFWLMQLGPDCRIYMSTGNGTDRLHVIEHPNLKGKDCGFRQHAVQLAETNFSTIPNFPNYRLGTPYPVCDSSIALVTTAVQVPPPLLGARLWPNPASGEVHLALPAALLQPGIWALYNGMGQRVRREVLAAGQAQHSLSIAGLPPGLYFWELKSSNRRLGGGKLVVQP